MKEQRFVRAVALVLGLLFLVLFFIVSGPLASSPAEIGPLHALSRFFNPGLKADPAQALTGHLVRVALGALALCWLALAAIPPGTADATIRAALRPGLHYQRALLALVLGMHVAGLGALLLFISFGGTPKWISEIYAFGVLGFFLSLLPRVLGLLVCSRLLFGRHRAAYDYHLGAFAALGSGIAVIVDLRHVIDEAGFVPVILNLIGQILFPALSIWADILLVRCALPLPGGVQSKGLAAYTVAGGLALAVGLGHILGIGFIFRFAPSIAWADAIVTVAFLAIAAACLSHAAAMAMIQPAQPSPAPPLAPDIAKLPEPTPSDVAPQDQDVPAGPRPQSRPSLVWVVDAVLGFICSGLLAVVAMYALTKVMPLGVLVYFPIAPIMSVGGFVVIVVGILTRRFGYVLGAALFELGFWLLAR
jgi:hypothetical protein